MIYRIVFVYVECAKLKLALDHQAVEVLEPVKGEVIYFTVVLVLLTLKFVLCYYLYCNSDLLPLE